MKIDYCRKPVYLISKVVDSPLVFLEKCRLNFHLLMCPACRRYLQQTRFVEIVLQKFYERKMNKCSQKLSETAKERMKKMLQGNELP